MRSDIMDKSEWIYIVEEKGRSLRLNNVIEALGQSGAKNSHCCAREWERNFQ